MCPMCRASLHGSCLGTSCDCSHLSPVTESDPSLTSNDLKDPEEPTTEEPEEVRGSINGNTRGTGTGGSRRLKRDATLKDQQSTGRKRAARWFPLDFEAACEWRGKSNCGGGTKPIVGCVSGLQQARHHGPDKSTSNNEVGNVHRICHRCHNRWHAANNATYDWTSTLVNSHAPRPQTKEEADQALLDELVYKGSKQKAIKD